MNPVSGWRVALLLGLLVAPAAVGQPGFQPDRRVREATRLDWEFAAGPAAALGANYDSRRQRYELFVPATYKPTKAWPMVVFVSPGDTPAGWRAWEKPCEQADWLYCAAHGAGNRCPPAQRVRHLLDMLDDVRRAYRVAPTQTYLAGFDGGAAVAFRLAASLPELFGGVIVLSGDAPLPDGAHLRRRLRDALSVALVCGESDRSREQMEKYDLPVLTALGARTRLWLAPRAQGGQSGHALPPAEVLLEVQRWLGEGLERRKEDSKREGLPAEEVPSRSVLAKLALERARAELADPKRVGAGVARLEWLTGRLGKTEAGQKAALLLDEAREEPLTGRRAREQAGALSRAVLLAQAKGHEQLGRYADARRAWDGVGKLADAPPLRLQAAEEVKRLDALRERTAFLGLTLEGDTTAIRAVTPGGPAHRAGLRAGDRLEQLGAVKVTTPAAVRRQLAGCKPGDSLRIELRRDERSLSLVVTIGAPPADS
jgi:predicted esterase